MVKNQISNSITTNFDFVGSEKLVAKPLSSSSQKPGFQRYTVFRKNEHTDQFCAFPDSSTGTLINSVHSSSRTELMHNSLIMEEADNDDTAILGNSRDISAASHGCERHRRATELTIIKARLACVEDHNNLARGMQRGSVPHKQLGICVVVSVIQARAVCSLPGLLCSCLGWLCSLPGLLAKNEIETPIPKLLSSLPSFSSLAAALSFVLLPRCCSLLRSPPSPPPLLRSPSSPFCFAVLESLSEVGLVPFVKLLCHVIPLHSLHCDIPSRQFWHTYQLAFCALVLYNELVPGRIWNSKEYNFKAKGLPPKGVVRDHLICNGFVPRSVKLSDLGFNIQREETILDNDEGSIPNESSDDVVRLLHDARDAFRDGPNDEAKKFLRLVEEGQEELYPGSKNHSKLSFMIRLFILKCDHNLTNAVFGDILELIREALPDAKFQLLSMKQKVF
uniref:Uncharacterized protein n=1 Tax=Chenopodium quinoa TaxID=63459 RepID=A0A803NE78_CHEQI